MALIARVAQHSNRPPVDAESEPRAQPKHNFKNTVAKPDNLGITPLTIHMPTVCLGTGLQSSVAVHDALVFVRCSYIQPLHGPFNKTAFFCFSSLLQCTADVISHHALCPSRTQRPVRGRNKEREGERKEQAIACSEYEKVRSTRNGRRILQANSRRAARPAS
jgi:hypothetical protein